jgi:hypothetical protein
MPKRGSTFLLAAQQVQGQDAFPVPALEYGTSAVEHVLLRQHRTRPLEVGASEWRRNAALRQ